MDGNGQIDLASAEPFRVGLLIAEPALRQVSTTITFAETIQPRVMQVLVALARANGNIVSRDALVRQCWEGRIVGNDSINRVISRLRRLSEERVSGSFQIETIAKVGYRLIGEVALLPSASPRPLSLDARNPSRAAGQVARRPPPWLIAGAVGVVGLIALASWWTNQPQRSHASRLAVGSFVVSGVPVADGETLRSAVVSTSMPEEFRAVPGPGSASDYRLTGKLIRSPDGLTLFGELRAPGAASPIWTPQIHYAATASLSGIAHELALAARCVIEGADEPPTPKPATAIAAWTRYCEADNKSDWDEDDELEALRAAIRSDPQFVSAQVDLATNLGYHVMHNGGRDPDGLRPEAMNALAAAERRDPDSASIYLARAILTPLEEFKSRDALISRALRSRAGGWGAETNAQGYFLESVGRLRDSLDAYRRNLTITPGNAITTIARAEVLSMVGHYRDAHPIFIADAATEPDRTRIDRIWLTAAITGRDWPTAKTLISSVPDDADRAAIAPLVDALASGNQAAARSAGAAFERIAADPLSMSALTVMGLAWSGRDGAAIDAAERRFRIRGYNNSLGVLYSPGFASARKTPQFEAMVRRIGLFNYWQSSGH